jgi:predicted RNA-binding Zn-ribbon protein involved in translation (DUF1610 family)
MRARDWRDDESEFDDDPEGPQECDLAEDDDESATFACPECGADVYEDADRCPACGRWVSVSSAPASGRQLLFMAIAVGLILLLLLLAL